LSLRPFLSPTLGGVNGEMGKVGRIVMRYKGIIASILEASAEFYELSDPTLGSLLNSVTSRHGYDLKKLVEDNPGYVVIVNGKNVDLGGDVDMELAEGSQVDILTMIAGGGCCG